MNDQSAKHRDDDEFARILQRKHEQLIQQTTEKPAPDEVETPADDERIQSAMMVLELLEELKKDHEVRPETQLETVANPSTQENPAHEAPLNRRSSIDTLVPSLSQLGRFQISEQIGRGGYGIVVRGFDPRLEREVAIKIPRFEAALSAESRTRFVRESKAAASLNHPGVVAIHETGSAEGIDFIVSELVDGENLATQLARGVKLTSEEAATLVAQLADAIEHAHQRGILHRDLKPSNVLIAGEDFKHPKITDFGLAAIVDQQDFTQTGAVVGTPAYMSPEQATGKKEIQPQTDVYGLGTILYQLLTGRPPFDGLPIIDTIRAIVDRDPIAPRAINPSISKDLESVCMKCLEKSPSQRYDSARALQTDLQRFLDNQPVSARPVTQSIRLRRWARRNPAVALSSLAATLFLLTALGASLWGWLSTSTALAGERKARIAANSAVNQYFTEIADNDLLDVPGMAPLRKKLLTHALDFYQTFLSEREDEPELLEEVEQAHFRVAKIFEELGEPKQSLENFQQALDKQDELISMMGGQAAILSRKMKTLRHIAQLQSSLAESEQAMATIDAAILGQRQLLESDPVSESLKHECALSLFAKAIMLKESAQLEPSKLLLEEAVSMMQALVETDPANVKFQRRLAGGYIDLANTIGQQGQLNEASELLDDAVSIFRQLINQQEQSPKDVKGLQDALYNRATKHLVKGEFADAQILLEEAAVSNEQLILMYPNIIEYRRQQAVIANGLGFCYSRLNTIDKAIEALITNAVALEHIVDNEPEVVDHRENLAVAKLNLGSIIGQHRNDFDDAKRYLNEAGNLFDEILIKNPDRLNAQIGSGLAVLNLAGNSNSGKKYDEALDAADRSLVILKALNESHPNHPQIAPNLPMAFQNRAAALEHLGRLEESIAAWKEAAGLVAKERNSHIQLKLAATLAKADRVTESIEILETVTGSPPALSKNAFDVARVRVLVAEALTQSDDPDQQQIESYCQSAIEALTLAQQQGNLQKPATVDKLKNSTEFDLLRQRDDFKSLLDQVDSGNQSG